MAKKKQFVTAAAAFAVAASAVAPAITADAASTTVRLSSDYVRGGDLDAALDKEYKGSEIYWYKSSIDMNKLGVFQTAKGFVKGKGIKVEKKLRVLNYAQEIKPESEFVFEQGVPVSGIRIQPVLFADGNEYAKPLSVAGFNTDKVGEFEGTLTYANKAYGTVTKTVKYKVVASKVEFSEVKHEVKDDMLSVSADVKNLKEGEKVELVIFPGKDESKALDPIAAEIKDGKVMVSAKEIPAGTHSFILRSGDVKTAAMEFKVEEQAPKVESVKAINGNQLLVEFNKAVDETTAIAPGSYSFSDSNSVASGELQADGKSVLLTLTNAYSNTSSHSVAVTIDGVILDGTVDETFPLYTSVVGINDVTKAEVSSVSAVTNTDKATSLTVNFSEPIATGAAFKINGVSTSASYSAGDTSVTLSVPAGLAVGSSHKIEVINLTDLSGNVNSVASKEFTITKDVAAPHVTSVVAHGDNQLLVTFDKNMKYDSAALSNLASNILVKNDVYNAVAVDSVSRLNGTSKTQFVVQLNRTAAAGLFSSTKTSHNLTVLFVNDTIQDYVGNKLVGTSTTTTISKDTVAPEVTGVSYKKNSAGEVTDIVVNFSEGLRANGSLAFPTSLVNENGVVVTSSSVFGSLGTANVAAGAKTATFRLSSAQTVSGKYTVDFAAGWVEDNSLAYNDSKAYTTVVDFGAAQTSGEFTIANGSVTNAGTNVIQVVFPEAVKGGAVAGSATDASRYTVNGQALPAGTTITLNAASGGTAAQTIATITLPAESVSTTDNAAVFTINGVQSLTGKTSKAFTKALTITDNVKPVLQSARVLDNKTIELTYSEALDALTTAGVGSEFVIYQDSTALSLTDAQLVGNTVAGFATKLRLTLNQGSDSSGSPASVGTVSKSNVTGATTSVSGTYTGTTNKTFVVRVASVDASTPKNVATWEISSDNGTTFSSPGTITNLGDGLTLGSFAAGTTDAAVGDTFTFTANAAVAPTYATTLDLTKDLSIETGTAVDVDDVAHNLQKAGIKISVSK